jgi:hypothetical protein
MASTAPTIPFYFNEPQAKDYLDHLTIVDQGTDETVTWAPAGVTFVVPPYEYSPSRKAITKANPGLVTFHSDHGFSIGTYHEFLIHSDCQHFTGFKMGKIEVTFGQATPLMAYLFEGLHRGKYYGEWESIHTARILGSTDAQETELSFSNAAIRYHQKHSVLPTLREMNLDDFVSFTDLDDADDAEPEVLIDGPVIQDMEPIRFLYGGLNQSDAVGGCLYFYRVLEFYAFSSMRKEFAKIRQDPTVSEVNFPTEILKLISRDEKGPMLRLVNQIAGKRLIKDAVRSGLIVSESANLLGENLYAFRNSIVHGKSSYGYELHSPSLLEKQTTPWAWRNVLKDLAKTAIDRFGTKLL